VDRAPVHDPEHAASGTIGFLVHHLGDESTEGDDGDLLDDLAEESGTMHVPSCDVGTDSMTTILVLDAHRAARSGWRDGMTKGADRDLRLLVSTDDELVLSQGSALPASVVEVEDAPCLRGELGIAREDPAPSAPRTQRILLQPSPDRHAA